MSAPRMLVRRMAALTIAICSSVQSARAQSAPLPIFEKLGQLENFVDLSTSPDGRFVLRAMQDRVDLLTVGTGRVIHLADGTAGDASWGPRGDRIVWSRWEGEPRLPTVWTIAINPTTGAPIGKPQRVSVGIGHTPALSFDGRSIAYSTTADTSSSALRNPARRIVIVPTLGGPERTVARTARTIDALFWSEDGQSLFAAGGSPDTTNAALTRISVADGSIRALSRLDAWIAGVSADRRMFALMPYGLAAASGQVVTLVDPDGRTLGTVPLPIGQRIFSAGLLKDSALVMLEFEDHWGLEIRNVAGGGARSLPIEGIANLAPKWSPDGRRLAFTIERRGERYLGVINTDGTGLREFRDVQLRPDEWGAQWSPDATTIAYQPPDRMNMYLFDVASGRSRTLLNNVQTGKFRWSIDGNAIVAYVMGAGMQRIALDGKRTTIMPESAVGGVRYVDVTREGVLLRNDTAAFVYPFDGSARRVLPALPTNARGTSVVSRDGRQVAAFIRDSVTDKLELFSTDGWQHRVVTLPFKLRAIAYDPGFAKGGTHLVVMGYRVADSVHQVFSVPLDGSRPTLLGSVGANQPGASLSVSPDGQQVVYTNRRSFARNLVLLDLRPALRSGARNGRDDQ